MKKTGGLSRQRRIAGAMQRAADTALENAAAQEVEINDSPFFSEILADTLREQAKGKSPLVAGKLQELAGELEGAELRRNGGDGPRAYAIEWAQSLGIHGPAVKVEVEAAIAAAEKIADEPVSERVKALHDELDRSTGQS